MFTVNKDSSRKKWDFEVRWNGGCPVARCWRIEGAQRIAKALNDAKAAEGAAK